jgi:hypothetical protein
MNLGDLLQSWVAGHSLADIIWARGWQFGILLALRFNMTGGGEELTKLEQEKVAG